MYRIFTANSKTEKRIQKYIQIRKDISQKLERLKQDPRKANDAHPLHGRLKDKWSCWLGSNIRIVYSINDEEKIIIIEAIGSHNFAY